VTLDFGAINWLAVFSAMVVYVILGAFVFAPQLPLGKAWMAAGAYESPTSGASAGALFYIVPGLGALASVIATALVVKATGTDTLTEGITLGLVVGIGYAVAILMVTAAFEFTKPSRWVWGLIDALYHLLGIVIASVILALWP
jgi:hypothetical protein